MTAAGCMASDISVMQNEVEIGKISRKIVSVRNILVISYGCRAYKVLHRPPHGLAIDLSKEFKLKED